MKQLNFLQNCTEPIQPIKQEASEWKLFIDGASRNNPGQAGAGIYLLKDGEPVYQEGFYLGIKTNNEAEYFALLLGLFFCKPLLFADDLLLIISDSELLIKQMKNQYKVRKPELKKMYNLAVILLENINYSLCHVKREYNKQADKLANKGVDKGSVVPKEFMSLARSHEIAL
ncbi:MAG: ribonuclease HI family protein [Candidatus Babeliales bacterium]